MYYIYILSYILNTYVSIRSYMGMRTGNHNSRSLRGWPVLFSRWGSPLEREATSSSSRANFGTFWYILVHLYTFIYVYIRLYTFIYIIIHLYTFTYIYDSFMPAILSFWTVWALEVPQLVSIWNLTFFSHYSKGETDFVAVFWLWNAPLLFLFILQIAALVNGCTFSFDRLTVLSFFRQYFYRCLPVSWWTSHLLSSMELPCAQRGLPNTEKKPSLVNMCAMVKSWSVRHILRDGHQSIDRNSYPF